MNAEDTVRAVAPCRVDLAGGTLDLWPLGLLVNDAVTINVAAGIRTGCTLTPLASGYELVQGAGQSRCRLDRIPRRPELEMDPQFALAGLVLGHLEAPPCRVESWSEAPRGSGLGASSSLAMALIAATAQWVGAPIRDAEAVALACDLETRLLRFPAGTQDHWSAQCGGASLLAHGAGGTRRVGLPLGLGGVTDAMVVADTGVAHHSGQNNWAVYKAFLDGEPATRQALSDVAAAAGALRDVLLSDAEGDVRLRAAAAALAAEWRARRRLAPAVSCPELEAGIAAAESLGGAGKACGAGGGGCVVCLPPRAADRPALMAALEKAGLRVLEAQASPDGVRVVRDGPGRGAPGLAGA